MLFRSPQTRVVEAGSFAEGIVATAMRIAGQVIEELEFAKDGEAGVSAESVFEFGQGCDFVAEQVLAEGLRIEGDWAHNVIVPTEEASQPELYHNCPMHTVSANMRSTAMITDLERINCSRGSGQPGSR